MQHILNFFKYNKYFEPDNVILKKYKDKKQINWRELQNKNQIKY